MKKVIALFLIGFIITAQFSLPAFAGEVKEGFSIEYEGKVVAYKSKVVTLNIDGQDLTTGEMPAIILDDRTLVPAREVFESKSFGASVEWNQKNQQVYITYKDKSIVLKIGSKTAYVNNKAITLDVPANLIRDTRQANPKTMIPLRFVTENLGYHVDWNLNTYTAKITSPNYSEPVREDDVPALPTALKNNPIIWEGDYSGDEEITESEIIAEDHSLVDIQAVTYNPSSLSFKIQASGPISAVEESFWDGKYIIDIINASYALDDGLSYKQTYAENPITNEVRSSQQKDVDGTKVLRIVFDLSNASANLDLSISQDRKSMTLKLQQAYLEKVELGQNQKGDYILLTGSSSPDISAFRLKNPNRIVFDLNNMSTLVGKESAEAVEGQFVSAIRTAPFNEKTTRITTEINGNADYTITKPSKTTTMIQFLKPSYSNIDYDNENTPTIILENIASKIKLEGITYEDYYFNKQYIINLPGNYEDVFGTGDMQIDDEAINNIEIVKNNSGKTSLVINEKGVYVFRLESDAKNIYIKAYKPKQIYSQVVVVDLGHGGSDPGAVNDDNPNKVYNEKTINLAIGTYLKGYLDADSTIKVYFTRTTDTTVKLDTRTPFANDIGADFLVSIHNNSSESPTASGTETLYYKDADIPGLNSIELASIVHKNVVNAIGLKDRKIRDDNGLFILRTSSMPSTIVEVGFVSNAGDVLKLSDPAVQKNVAKAIYNAIVEVFRTYPTGR